MAIALSTYPGVKPATSRYAGTNDLGKTGTFLPSLSYAGSSSTRTPKNFDTSPDYPVINAATGQMESIKTGKPWTGPIPGQAAPVPTGADRYQALNVVKAPEVAAATTDLLGSFKAITGETMKGWEDYFNEAKAAAAANKTAFNKEQQAQDIAPLAATLRNTNINLAGQTEDIANQYRQSDSDYEAKQRALTQQAYDTLPQYEKAAQDVADRQFAVAGGQVNRYKAASGTPTSLGGSELALLNRAASDVYLPLKKEEIARRLGLITDVSMPLEREYATRDTARLTGFELPNARYTADRTADTEKNIKQLELAVSGMSRASAESYLKSLGLPAQIASEILQRHIQNLSGLSQLDEASNYRGLQDLAGINPSTPTGYSVSTPGYPQFPVSAPNGYNNSVNSVPQTVTGTTLPAWVNAQRKAQGWQADANGQYTINVPTPPRNDTGNWANE